MNENVGSIEYDARINTSRLKGDARETDAIVSKTGDNVEKTGKNSFGEFGQWAKVGLAAAGVATAALGVAAFKTGIEYNTLQQTSRAALKTILGGAEAANAQMDKLDAFARNSPFAKDVFIKAQQQLLGFGVEASKVIPALNAIQQAVAAVGGSSDDIAQITAVLAKIQAQGRLSGEELLQLGGYGIDAATIIGKGMGKTGQEIRAMASEPGGIPVAKIWDPLVNGLDEKFGGAADNVKKTWSGTVDRITAAFRDVGAAIAAPFVDPNGGGKAVEWGNSFASQLRSIEKSVGPTMETIKGFINEVVNAIRPLTDFIANNTEAWEVLKTALVVIAATIGVLIIAVGVTLIAAFAALQWIINIVIDVIEAITDAINWLGKTAEEIGVELSRFGKSVSDAFTSVANTISVALESVMTFLSEVWAGIVKTFGDILGWFNEYWQEILAIIFLPFSLALGYIIQEWSKISAFFMAIWNSIVIIFSPFVDFFTRTFTAVHEMAILVTGGIIMAFQASWDAITTVFGVMAAWFGDRWQEVMAVFSGVAQFFGSVFTGASSSIKSSFSGIVGFFSGIWNSIIGLFGSVGTSVGNVIGNAFRNVMNSVLRSATDIINGFINGINGAIDVINKIPGVGIGKLGTLPVPQMATGGIVTSPTLAMIGEGRESEAVIPLSKLDAMMDNQGARDSGGNVNIELNMSGIMTRSRSDTRAVAADLIESINEQMRARQLPEIGQGYLRKGTI